MKGSCLCRAIEYEISQLDSPIGYGQIKLETIVLR